MALTSLGAVAVAQNVAAAAPSGQGGVSSSGARAAGAEVGGAPTPFTSFTLNGGYVAAGTGLRNRGFGTINIAGIPPGAGITAAYLYWTILGPDAEPANFKSAVFAGTPITGVTIGSGVTPCWANTTTTGYSHWANVTSLVSGNGAYGISGVASGATDGSDPQANQTAPLAEGASLVVIFAKASYPSTKILISDGYGEVQTSPGLVTNMNWGFAATTPVGQVVTTFIGGDGQNTFSEPPSKFNTSTVPLADWDGTDPPFPAYSGGNLWDTDTVKTANKVHPGNTSANITVAGGPDCLAWVAQVLSIGVNGAVDTDGDKLLDGWEANGYDANGDGVIDDTLPVWGASPVHKDLFVEMDYMGAEAECPCHLPLTADLDRIVKVFGAAPQANNPDGLTGIKLHLDAGSARGTKYNLGGGNLVAHDNDLNPVATQFNAIKAANFNSLRAKIFYYMIWAHGYDGGSSSGNAFAIPNDSFVVTLGLWPSHGTSDVKVGTFVHEFGHDLGQQHGGTDGVNYKPNYLSVMNYAFQVTGVPKIAALPPNFGYSSATLPSLNENSLNEAVGLNSSAANLYKTRWFCPGQVESPGTANGPLDWNCNGVTSGTVAVDINGDGVKNTLTTFNNWGNIVYGGGAVGPGVSAGVAPDQPVPAELTYEDAHAHHLTP